MAEYTNDYLLNRQVKIFQPVDGYRASTDAVILSSLVQKVKKNDKILDVGSGTGAISLCLAARFQEIQPQITGIEIQPELAELSARSAEANGFSAFLHYVNADIRQKITAVPPCSFRHVITNPPYVPQTDIPEQPEVRDWDPELALYGGSADGTLIPERIIARAAKLLRAGGLMVMEHDITQGERLAAFARTCGFVDVTVHNDYTGRPRYLTAEKQPAQ